MNFLRSLSGPAFWLVITALSIVALLLVLIAFSLVKPSLLRWR